MGNCLVIQDDRDKEIKIMGMDGGEILKLQQDALAGFPPSHGIVSDDDAAVPAQQHLDDMAAAGQLYHLFPAKAAPPAAAAAVDTGGVVRVKLVISKQQLKKMLHKDAISLDDMVSLMQKQASEQEIISCRGWRPALKSIPEGSDC
ncbi:hypothetical protein E2562_024356 [Oryza meyeriana var. granulata]|uniref:Uncharacterized protein n=1 Tax=Oryza meyeriana var. granulata TaxID=110450 RepID=A0A6G1C919_9ORYZ|nr:hypothetical protein E2562_024356 [Oryza meyeriana var. granulata]